MSFAMSLGSRAPMMRKASRSGTGRSSPGAKISLQRYDAAVYRHRSAVHLVVVLLLMAGPTLQPLTASELAAITGQVFDPTNKPLFGARVRLSLMSDDEQAIVVRSDREGRYVVDAVPNGTYYIEAAYDGFLTVRYTPIEFRFSKPKKLDFVLPINWHEARWLDTFPLTQATLLGQLTLDDKPLVHTKVCLVGKVEELCTQSNSLGHYELNIAPGVYLARVYRGEEPIFERSVHLDSTIEYINLISDVSEEKQ